MSADEQVGIGADKVEGILGMKVAVAGATSLDMSLTRTTGAVSFARPQDPVPPFPYRGYDVAYLNRADGTRLAGTLTLPEGDGPFPAVLLLSGSGPQDRNGMLMGHRPFLVLSDHLTRRGVAVHVSVLVVAGFSLHEELELLVRAGLQQRGDIAVAGGHVGLDGGVDQGPAVGRHQQGVSGATTPVELITPDNNATASIRTTIRRRSLVPAICRIRSPMAAANPVWNTAPPTTNRKPMLSTAVLEKPATASSVETTPVRTSESRTSNATRSIRSHSVMNNTTATTRMMSVISMSGVIGLPSGGIRVETTLC